MVASQLDGWVFFTTPGKDAGAAIGKPTAAGHLIQDRDTPWNDVQLAAPGAGSSGSASKQSLRIWMHGPVKQGVDGS
jgi:hypothetical protein